MTSVEESGLVSMHLYTSIYAYIYIYIYIYIEREREREPSSIFRYFHSQIELFKEKKSISRERKREGREEAVRLYHPPTIFSLT